jgi:hypothetical protein
MPTLHRSVTATLIQTSVEIAARENGTTPYCGIAAAIAASTPI